MTTDLERIKQLFVQLFIVSGTYFFDTLITYPQLVSGQFLGISITRTVLGSTVIVKYILFPQRRSCGVGGEQAVLVSLPDTAHSLISRTEDSEG